MESKVLRSLVLCAMVGLLFAFVGCSKSNPIIPPDENQTDNGLPRWLFWAGDGEIVNAEYAEKKADVTNVVLDPYYMNKVIPFWLSTNGRRGYILKEEYDIPDDPNAAEMNVVAWTEWEDEAWQVYFRVVVDGSIDGLGRVKVDKPLGYSTANQAYPAVTARIHRDNPETEQLLMVDIAYQLKKAASPKEIWHSRYIQDDANDYDNFSVDAIANPVAFAINADFLHPDIVYATYWEVVSILPFEFYDINKLLITYEKLLSGTRYIKLAESSADGTPSWNEEEVYDGGDDEPGWFPRIDAGLDDFDDNDDYLAGIVWHVYTEDGVSVYYAYKIYNTASPSVTPGVAIDDMSGDGSYHNGVPFIDIDPLENKLEDDQENYAHIVWSKIKNEQGTDIKPYYTNSSMIEDNVDVKQIYSTTTPLREGLPVISTYADQTGNFHGTVEFISYTGDLINDYVVYSVDFWLDGDDENDPLFTAPPDKWTVSDPPHHSSDAGPPWIHGPSSAVFGSTSTLCAWTEWSDDDSKPDIYFDVN